MLKSNREIPYGTIAQNDGAGSAAPDGSGDSGDAMRFGSGMAVVMFLIVRLAPEQLLNLLSNAPLVIA